MSTLIQQAIETPEVGVPEKKSGLMRRLWHYPMTGSTMKLLMES